MSYNIRIDPLTIEGRFDLDFFSDEDYKLYKEKVEKYIKAEGFDKLKGTYFLTINKKQWQVVIS